MDDEPPVRSKPETFYPTPSPCTQTAVTEVAASFSSQVLVCVLLCTPPLFKSFDDHTLNRLVDFKLQTLPLMHVYVAYATEFKLHHSQIGFSLFLGFSPRHSVKSAANRNPNELQKYTP